MSKARTGRGTPPPEPPKQDPPRAGSYSITGLPWCFICSRYEPCRHTWIETDQAKFERLKREAAYEREVARRAAEDTRNLNAREALQAKYDAEKKSPPSDSEEYWKQVHEDANRARRAAGLPEQPAEYRGSPEWKARQAAWGSFAFGFLAFSYWRERSNRQNALGPQQKGPEEKPPAQEVTNVRDQSTMTPKARKPDLCGDIKSSFRVAGSTINIPGPEHTERIDKDIRDLLRAEPWRKWHLHEFLINETHGQTHLAAQADAELNRIVESRWPIIGFSDLESTPGYDGRFRRNLFGRKYKQAMTGITRGRFPDILPAKPGKRTGPIRRTKLPHQKKGISL